MYTTIGPSDIENRNDPQPVFTPGRKYASEDGNIYRYVKVVDAVAPVAGQCAYWSDDCTAATGLIYATADYSEAAGLDKQNSGCGTWTYAATQNYYTFIQTGGIKSLDFSGAAAGSAGCAIIAGAADVTAGTANWAVVAADTAPTNRVIAWALLAEAANVVLAELVVD